ncbi:MULTISPECIES: succinate dehydrogenase, cytochrome b556 subunit [unclassified Chelatococcus]|uniref:succinate dehydrogenase, cytochrome b556 subunit n=1 Tax=unclassified Chelatococcus TaxID=2638111 RepID=UPI001BD03306|nr:MULTISPECIES: succinate dehydrogenase, cytochrome b556 subunit [unclassified Chelatococcus]MBS7697237.1 succinate dehydrogenase, cytochrome b556 subunit [Chelatococcus sp. YT9]MBX3556466.1 succinate dehydrogenase, cytochrome b556 subunit [Chelatococcus sp.]
MAEAKAPTSQPAHSRPLSPHLQVWRWTWTMAMSVAHRVTGSALYVGTLLLVIWLVALASGPRAFEWVQWFMGSWLGYLILFGYTWALLHHMMGGLRHFMWDLGRGFEPKERLLLAQGSLIASAVLTLLVWAVGLSLS